MEAQIDGTTCSQDNENIFAVGSSIAAFDEAVAYLFFRRIQNDVYKLLVRVKDIESSVAVDKWVSVSDWSNVMIQISADGVKVDGTSVSGITSANIANINSKGSYTIGAMCSKLTTATYDHITVFRRN